jgi:FkbM family methyltransferase
MLENIRLNGLEDKIIPINAGLASRRGEVCVEDVDTVSTAGVYHKPGSCGGHVDAITLGEVLEKYVGASNYPLVFKLDCEGCEYDVILNDYESVRRFDEIVFEYHSYAVNRPVTDLLRVLGGDYDCRIISDDDYYKRYGRMRDELGLIWCANKTAKPSTDS